MQVQYQGGYQQYSSQDSLPDSPYSSQSLDSHAGQTTGSMIEIMRMKILAVIDSVDIHKHGILFGQCLFCLVSYPMLPIFLRSFCRHAAIDAELEQNEGRSRWKQPTTFFKSSLWTQSGWLIYVGLCILDHVVGSCILYFGSNLPLSSNPAYGLSQVGWTAAIMKPIMCFVPFCWQLSF